VTPKDFKHWRKGVMRMSQKEAAEALGLKRRVVQYYEKGERDGDAIDIPKAVRLACFALSQGVTDYHGPEAGARGVPPDPEAGTRPAPDAVAGRKKRKKDAVKAPAQDPPKEDETPDADAPDGADTGSGGPAVPV
jgi:hypothetical protein